MKISDELWEKIKEGMCDNCRWLISGLNEDQVQAKCDECPMNWPDEPMGHCPYQE